MIKILCGNENIRKSMLAISALVGLFLAFSAVAAASDSEIIRGKLTDAARAWNRHDLAPMLSLYKKSDKTVYLNRDRIVGYDEIAASLRKRFPAHADMGQLSFSDLDIRMLSPRYAFVVGHWMLRRQGNKQDVGGYFTVLFEKTNNDWKIIVDHANQVT